MSEDRKGRFGWVRRLIRSKTVSIPPSVDESNGSRYNSTYSRQPEHHSDGNHHSDDNHSDDNHSDSAYSGSRHRYRGSQGTEVTEGTVAMNEYPSSVVSLSQNSDGLSGSPGESRPSRVQIVETRPQNKSDCESVFSSTHDSTSKRRSNSNFTVPSISRTSITTVSPSISETGSIHTIPSSLVTPLGSNLVDTASVVTIASSSKHHHRSSFDTNASTRAIAPDSILMRDEDDLSVAEVKA